MAVTLWLSKTLLSVGMRFLTMRGRRGPAWRAMALPREAAGVTEEVTRDGRRGRLLDAHRAPGAAGAARRVER